MVQRESVGASINLMSGWKVRLQGSHPSEMNLVYLASDLLADRHGNLPVSMANNKIPNDQMSCDFAAGMCS